MINYNSKIFITGATGFLGSYVVRTLLARGYKNLYGLRRSHSDMSLIGDAADKVEWIIGDVLDVPLLYEVLSGKDAVVHIAATVTFDPSRKKEMQAVNIEGTANIVHASLANNIKKLVHVSSIAALGRAKEVIEVDEKTSWVKSKSNTFYGKTKHHAELEVWKGQAEGLNTLIVNPSLIIGAGNWSSSSCTLFDKIYKGLSHYPKGTNGVVDVRDVAFGISEALEKDLSGERIILSAENLPYKSILNQIATNLGVKGPDKPLTRTKRTLAWIFEWLRSKVQGLPPIFTRESVRSTATTCYYDNQKSIDLLGMKYRPINQVIEDTSKAFLSDMKSGKAFSILPL